MVGGRRERYKRGGGENTITRWKSLLLKIYTFLLNLKKSSSNFHLNEARPFVEGFKGKNLHI